VDGTNDAHMPNGRYFHAAEIVHSRREIYVYGGLTQIQTPYGRSTKYSMKILSDFWKFSLKDQRWIGIQVTNIDLINVNLRTRKITNLYLAVPIFCGKLY